MYIVEYEVKYEGTGLVTETAFRTKEDVVTFLEKTIISGDYDYVDWFNVYYIDSETLSIDQILSLPVLSYVEDTLNKLQQITPIFLGE